MKAFFIIMLCFISLQAKAKRVNVDVLSVELGVMDHLGNKTLCLTVVRVPSSGELLGLVEDIYSCYYGRAASKAKNNRLHVEMKELRDFSVNELKDYFQALDSQLKFYYIDTE